MRVDRNGSVLAMLFIALPESDGRGDPARYLGPALRERLRVTDTIGWLFDGRLGVLLPDTPARGAQKVADDIQELLGGGGVGPDCELLMYPDEQPGVAVRDQQWTKETVRETAAADASTVVTGVTLQDLATKVESRAFVRRCDRAFERVFAAPLPWWKRTFDIVFGSIALVATAPAILACAGAVVLTSRGGPFFVQQREGLGGRRFPIFKIRTMRHGAEEEKSLLRGSSEQDGPAFKMADDPRMTPVGRVLRKLSLDELPQLLNVIRGEMSLVGPRPLPVDESQQCTPWQRRRLLVTPGITCTWQARARNSVPFDEWVRMDLRYIQRRSPWLDFKLLLETAPALIVSKGPR